MIFLVFFCRKMIPALFVETNECVTKKHGTLQNNTCHPLGDQGWNKNGEGTTTASAKVTSFWSRKGGNTRTRRKKRE